MEMANNNEETKQQEMQEQETPAIEVDATVEVHEEVNEVTEDDKKVEEVSEGNEEESKQEENSEKDDTVANDTQKEENSNSVEEQKVEVEEEDNNNNNNKDGEGNSDDKDDSKDDSDSKTEAEPTPDEPTEKEKELIAQIETYKEAEELRELAIMKNQAETQLDTTTNQVHDALIATIKKYEIPEDKTLNELRTESPEKAAILEGLLTKAQEVIQITSANLSAQIEEKAKDVLFNKAGKMFEAYKMTEEQAEIAATTFITIMNQVGVNDLGEDLAAKVKLSVAQAKMDSPDVVEVTQVNTEEVKVEDVQNVIEPIDAVEEEKKEEEEENTTDDVAEQVKELNKPDLSEFMEGIEGTASKASDINTDNVLAKLNALPFSERTKFYKENMDLINEAMKKARGNL